MRGRGKGSRNRRMKVRMKGRWTGDDWCMKVNEERNVSSPVMFFLTKRY